MNTAGGLVPPSDGIRSQHNPGGTSLCVDSSPAPCPLSLQQHIQSTYLQAHPHTMEAVCPSGYTEAPP